MIIRLLYEIYIYILLFIFINDLGILQLPKLLVKIIVNCIIEIILIYKILCVNEKTYNYELVLIRMYLW